MIILRNNFEINKKSIIKLSILILTLIIFIFLLFSPLLARHAFAADNPQPVDPCNIGGCIGGIQNNDRYTSGTGGDVAQNIIIDVATFLTYIAASVAILYIVYQGFKYLISDGDAKKIEEARKGIIYGVVGLVVTVAAYGVIAGIINVLSSLRFRA
jgi:hypothetical protein